MAEAAARAICPGRFIMKLTDAAFDSDKRQHKRFKVRPEGLVGKLDDERFVEIVDLSVGGIAMTAGSRLSVGKEYFMRLHDRRNSLEVRGTIVRSRIMESRMDFAGQQIPVYAAAMRLQEGLEDRVVDFICDALLASGR
jgi:hypothetical protein